MFYEAPRNPALSCPLPSFTVTFPPDALGSLLLLQHDQLVPAPGPLLVLFPPPGSLFHSIQVSVPTLLLRGAIPDHPYKSVAPQSLSPYINRFYS